MKTSTKESCADVAILIAAPANLFNEIVSRRAEYQEHLDAWGDYEAAIELFPRTIRPPLPEADDFFDLTDGDWKAVKRCMIEGLRSARRDGENLSDPDTRRDAFTDALSSVFETGFVQGDRERQTLWGAFCRFEEKVYHKEQSWAQLRANGQDMQAAWRLTRAR